MKTLYRVYKQNKEAVTLALKIILILFIFICASWVEAHEDLFY